MTPHDRREAEGRRERQPQAPAPPRRGEEAARTPRSRTRNRRRRTEIDAEAHTGVYDRPSKAFAEVSGRGGRSRASDVREEEQQGGGGHATAMPAAHASGSRPATGRPARGRTSWRPQLRGRSPRSARAAVAPHDGEEEPERQCHVRRLVRVDHGRPEQRDAVYAPVAHTEHQRARERGTRARPPSPPSPPSRRKRRQGTAGSTAAIGQIAFVVSVIGVSAGG